jgi:hypothetical protein
LSRRKDRFQLYGDFVAQFNRAPSPGEIKLLAAKPKKEPPTKVEAVLATPATEVTKAPAVAPTVNAKDLLVAHLGHMWAYIAKITAGDTTAEVMFESALQLVGKAELDPIPPAANSKLSDYVHPEGAPPPFSFRDDPKAYELVLGISALARDVVEEIGKQMPPRASWGLVDLENGDYEIRVPLSENETEEHAQRSNAHTWAVKLSLIMRVPAPDRVRETAVCFPR